MKILTMPRVLFVFAAVFFSSCTSMLYTSLDVLKPAKVTFDPGTNNLLIINNTVKQPDDYGHKTEFYNEKTKNIRQKADSLPLFCLNVVYEELANKEFFNTVQLHENSVNNKSDFFTIYPVSTDSINALCKKYGANVVLSLDRLKANDKITELFFDDTRSYYMALVARYESQWSIHYPGKDNYEKITFRDTIYWDAESYQRQKALSELPARSDALVDGALYVGQNSIKRFVPYWDKSDRYFFNTSNKYMKQGMDSLYVKNWEAAISIWEKAMDKSGRGLKAKLSNNIAVAYEITGDIDKAIEYAKKAYEYFESGSMLLNDKYFTWAINYLKELSQRKNEIELIDKQLGD